MPLGHKTGGNLFDGVLDFLISAFSTKCTFARKIWIGRINALGLIENIVCPGSAISTIIIVIVIIVHLVIAV